MKRIEDDFQILTDKIVVNPDRCFDPSEQGVIRRFFALWYFRALFDPPQQTEMQLQQVTGSVLTKDEDEKLEKNGYMFLRSGGRWPTRQLTGLTIQKGIDSYEAQLLATSWAVVWAQDGEFLFPDCPNHLLIPLTPTLCIYNGIEHGDVTRETLAEINDRMRAKSESFVFARDLNVCASLDKDSV
jgi:hypothetical protein